MRCRLLLVLATIGMMVALLAGLAGVADADVWHVTEYGSSDGYSAGDLTASGAPAGGFTAASPSLPFGTVVEVCYDGCVDVTITDRCACSLDLWATAAVAIGLPGGADAEVTILG